MNEQSSPVDYLIYDYRDYVALKPKVRIRWNPAVVGPKFMVNLTRMFGELKLSTSKTDHEHELELSAGPLNDHGFWQLGALVRQLVQAHTQPTGPK